MKMRIGKWGNSLAVRLPREIVEKYDLKEGDALDTEAIEAALSQAQDAALQARRDAALEEIRKRAYALPPDWKFDREEANWRPWMDKW
jgi:antitoxin MazE